MRARGRTILWALWFFALAGIRGFDPFGDRGLTNVVTGALLVLAALALFVSFLRRRSIPLRLRLGTLAAAVLGLTLFLAFVRVAGVSGEMIPRFAWRSASAPAEPPAPAAPTAVHLAAPAATDFPAFLGARRDNAVSGVHLARDWKARPPVLRWKGPIGAGWSAFALAGGCAFTLEQDGTLDGATQRVSARALADGALLWSVALDEPFAHALGGEGPRATPAVVLGPEAGLAPGTGRVFAQSAWGRLVALDAASGAVLWSHDLAAEHGLTRERESELAQYGRSSSPLVVSSAAGELVIVPAGGEPGASQAGLVAFELASGAQRWASPGRNFSYSSPTLATLGGVAQVLCVNEASLTGHALDDGRILWERAWPGSTSGDASVSQPLPLAPDRVFVSKGYGQGALLFALERASEGGFTTRDLWHEPRYLRTKFTNVALHAGHLYGLDDGMLECVELASGAKRWKEGRYGHGQLLLAGELLLLCSEEGELFLIDPSPERPNDVLASAPVLTGKCWAHLALAGNLLCVRNAEECAAWELPEAE
jgi:outer membrane protein assembly factor BamB